MFDIKLRGFFDDVKQELRDDDILLLYRWVSMPRFAAVVVCGSAIAFFWAVQTIDFDPRPILFGLIPTYIFTSLLVDRLIRRKVYPLLLINLQLLIDLIGVTFGVLLTGGVRSPFTGLYILVIISASIISVKTLVGVGLVTAVVYEMMAVAEHAGLFPITRGMSGGYQQQEAITIVILGLIIALIAFQSSFYVSRIREKDEEVVRLKDEFMFRTIHDLRSPSTIIKFTLEKYKEKLADDGGKHVEFKTDVALVDHALGRMSRLIEDLLKIAAGERPEFAIRADRIDLDSVITDAADELRPLMDKKKITFTYSVGKDTPYVIGDAEKLKEIFNNFFDNAIKYNREGGFITVAHRRQNGFLATEITDTGTGISEKNLEKLFTPYFRGDAGRDVQGTGLGLYLTKKLIEKMRGHVEAKSVKGSGTTFIVLLPVDAA